MHNLIKGTLLLVMLTVGGCCTERNSETMVSVDSYVAALERIQTNIVDDIRPGYAEALAAGGFIDELVEARLGLVDDTLTLIADTLAGANEPEGETAEDAVEDESGGDE